METATGIAYSKLDGEPFMAIRFSGTAEDLADASFVGLHDTLLDIKGSEGVVAAVLHRWASL